MFHFGWKKGNDHKNKVSDSDIVSIADGKIVDLSCVTDDVFKNEMLGKTLVFHFDQDKVEICAPTNGTLSVVFPTCHAFGITRDDGVEVLIHIGVDTVEANGKGFVQGKFKQGDRIEANDVLVTVDMKTLRQQYDMSVMLIITNDNQKKIEFIKPCEIKQGESILVEPIQ